MTTYRVPDALAESVLACWSSNVIDDPDTITLLSLGSVRWQEGSMMTVETEDEEAAAALGLLPVRLPAETVEEPTRNPWSLIEVPERDEERPSERRRRGQRRAFAYGLVVGAGAVATGFLLLTPGTAHAPLPAPTVTVTAHPQPDLIAHQRDVIESQGALIRSLRSDVDALLQQVPNPTAPSTGG